MQTTKSASVRVLGAVLKYELDRNFCRGHGTFTNATPEPIQLQPGQLLTGADKNALYDEANAEPVTAMNITEEYVQPGATINIAFLERGPATLNTNEMDLPADAAARTTVTEALEGLGFKLVAGI